MLYLVIWSGVVLLLAIWSVFVWLLHALTAWSLEHAAALGQPMSWLEQIALPAWVTVWLPADALTALKASVAAAWPWVESMLELLPDLAGGLGVLAWVVWGLGLFLLLVGAGLVHLFVAWTRKPQATPWPAARP